MQHTRQLSRAQQSLQQTQQRPRAANTAAVAVQTSSPAAILKLLESDANAQIIDIRNKEAVKEAGSPDLKGTKKSLISLPYKPAPGPKQAGTGSTVGIGWAERVKRMGKIKPESTIVLLDSDGTVAGAASQELAAAMAAGAPKGTKLGSILRPSGGAAAWKAGDLPWKEPSEGLNLNLNLDAFKSIDLSGVSAGAPPSVCAPICASASVLVRRCSARMLPSAAHSL